VPSHDFLRIGLPDPFKEMLGLPAAEDGGHSAMVRDHDFAVLSPGVLETGPAMTP